MSQEIFSVNSKLIKKAVQSIKKFNKNSDLYFYGDGSEVYLYCFMLNHCDYVQYKLEDIKIATPFLFSSSIEEIESAVLGSSGDILISKHSENTIEIDANTKKSYVIIKKSDITPLIKFEYTDEYLISGDELACFSKALLSNFINSWSVIDDFYYMHINKDSERVLSPNIIFYKSRTTDNLSVSIPGFIIKNFPNKSDAHIYVEKCSCRLEANNFSVVFKNKYCSPTYVYNFINNGGIPFNTEKLLNVISAIDKTAEDDIIEICYISADSSVVFQSGSSKYKFNFNKDKIKATSLVRTSCSNFKKAIAFLSGNESINLNITNDKIELSYVDDDDIQYVVLGAKR